MVVFIKLGKDVDGSTTETRASINAGFSISMIVRLSVASKVARRGSSPQMRAIFETGANLSLV